MKRITASEVIINKTYRIVSNNFAIDYTINEIIITKVGRYKFVSDIKWTNTDTDKVTIQKNIKSTSAVSGNCEIF